MSCDTSTTSGHHWCNLNFQRSSVNLSSNFSIYTDSQSNLISYQVCYGNVGNVSIGGCKGSTVPFNNYFSLVPRDSDLTITRSQQSNINTVNSPPLTNTSSGFSSIASNGGDQFVIVGLEVATYSSSDTSDNFKYNQNDIGKLTAVYYASLKDVTNPSNWWCYSDGEPFINIQNTYQNNDISTINNVGIPIGDHVIDNVANVRQKLIPITQNKYGYVLVGLSFNTNHSNDNNARSHPISILEAVFRNVFDLTDTYIIHLENGLITYPTTVSTTLSSSTVLNNSVPQFIQQIEVVYWDTVEPTVNACQGVDDLAQDAIKVGNIAVGFLAPIACSIIPGSSAFASFLENMTYTDFSYRGIKGFTQVTVVSFPDLQDIINTTSPLTCCQLIYENMYDTDSIESQNCIFKKNLIITQDFPLYYPNSGTSQCYNILQSYCEATTKNSDGSTSYQVTDPLCGSFCSLGLTQNSFGQNITSSNCDNAINAYCNNPNFMNKDDNGKSVKDLQATSNDPICACTLTPLNYSTSTTMDQYLLNLPTSLNLVVRNQLNNPDDPTNGWSPNARVDCGFPPCSKSNFKLLAQKQDIQSKPCSNMEQCIGNGFDVPIYSKQNYQIDCVREINNPTQCQPGTLDVQNTLNPKFSLPEITFMPDPLSQQCKSYFKNASQLTLPIGPVPCQKSGYINGPCVNGKQIQYKEITSPSYPANDPTLCDTSDLFNPASCNDQKYITAPDTCPASHTCPMPEEQSSLLALCIIIVISLFLIYIVYRIIKKLMNR